MHYLIHGSGVMREKKIEIDLISLWYYEFQAYKKVSSLGFWGGRRINEAPNYILIWGGTWQKVMNLQI